MNDLISCICRQVSLRMSDRCMLFKCVTFFLKKNASLLNILYYCMLDSYFSAAQKFLSNMSINIYKNKSVISKRKDGVVLTPSGQMTLLQLGEARCHWRLPSS